MSTVIRWFLRLVYLAFACVLAATAVGLYLLYQLYVPVGIEKPTVYTVRPGVTAQEISDDLAGKGFIRSAYALRLFLRLTHKGGNLQPGEHTITPGMNALQIVDELNKVVLLPAISVTIPEGLTDAEIARRIQRKLKIPAQTLLSATLYPATTFPDRKYLPKADSLEGYLFPDTYQFDPKVAPKQVVERFLKGFEDRVMSLPEVKSEAFPQAPAVPGGSSVKLTLQQVVTLASLVEAEAKVDRDRALIAGVYLNRLRKGMRLECDATILYAMGTRKILSLADLHYASPYNTYLHDSLPPGPICNPGLKSILAALHPKGDYLYYVRNDVKADGSHVFARSFEEHNANIRKYTH